jgi:hypothetical protein
MSLDKGAIFITPDKEPGCSNWMELFDFLLKYGRSAIMESESAIIPVGTNDYDWSGIILDSVELRKLIECKMRDRELIGISLYRINGPSGKDVISLTKAPDGPIMFSLSSDCAVISGTHLTDFSSYLPVIAYACFQAFGVITIECRQVVDRI